MIFAKDYFMIQVIDYYSRGCADGLTKSCYLAGVKCGAKAEKYDKSDDKITDYTKVIALLFLILYM